MNHERYSALWVFVPLCGALIALTGGMLFGGWFARDFDLLPGSRVLVAAFVSSVALGIAIIGGYLAVLRRWIPARRLKVSLAATLFIALCGLAAVCAVDGVSGQTSSFVPAGGLLLVASYVGVGLKRSRLRR